MPPERLWQVLVLVIPVAPLVWVVAILVSPRGLVTLRSGIGVALILEQLIKLLFVLDSGSEPDILVVNTAAGRAYGDIQVISSQPHDDFQHGLRAASQVGCNLGAESVRPAPTLR